VDAAKPMPREVVRELPRVVGVDGVHAHGLPVARQVPVAAHAPQQPEQRREARVVRTQRVPSEAPQRLDHARPQRGERGERDLTAAGRVREPDERGQATASPGRSVPAARHPARVRIRWSAVASMTRPFASRTRTVRRTPRATAPRHGATRRTASPSQQAYRVRRRYRSIGR
jgi:hypothetical protein